MANQEQLEILEQGVDKWNRWRSENPASEIDLIRANLKGANLQRASFSNADLRGADLRDSNLTDVTFDNANLTRAILSGARFSEAYLSGTILASIDLSMVIGLEETIPFGPSIIEHETFTKSKGKIPEAFLRGCGLSDWEIESAKLYAPDLSNEEINRILYNMYDLRASQALQISPLFISYSRTDSPFVDRLEGVLNEKGIRFWRDVHDAIAGRLETQIDHAIRQNPTVLLVLSGNALQSDWVEHEVRKARDLEKEMKRDILCPVALDETWKTSPWPKRVMEQVMEYNILDFSEWKDDAKFQRIFAKLIDGLELFYKE